ncbi:acyl-CoA thioesterase domain-containing protein [Brevundimonas sp.]|uniref:acyl-CoA thioesterase domain-containing protein n=1 Tax=Brevundimonas sp. TaxID=1871086 RepID=UPI00289EA71B|nr:acyl-CoA thioesterase domain-containing protein [Brevundimonas sp.]
MNAFYTQEVEGYTPAAAAASPWSKRHQSGIPIAGLLAHTLTSSIHTEGLFLARISIDILRPAPMAVTQTRCERTATCDAGTWARATLVAAGRDVAVATALFTHGREPDEAVQTAPYPSPDLAPNEPINRRIDTGMDSKVLYGGLKVRGPGAAWVRPRLSILDAEPASPTVGAVMAADFGGALSSVHDGRIWSFANVDLNVHFARSPRSEWIRVQSVTHTQGEGSALVDTRLSDLFGDFAYARQTLFIAPQPSADRLKP